MQVYWQSQTELILRLVVAMALGYIIGLERQLRGQPAGERTHALVALASATFMVISGTAFPTGDPGRIAAQVVVGLGFLGAGMIIQRGKRLVLGLTTAAGIWSVGAMGLAIGAGLYAIGISAAVLIFLILVSERILHLDERLARRIEASKKHPHPAKFSQWEEQGDEDQNNETMI